MAEVFGLAAGVVGVASLAIQLAERATKITILLRSVKDLPSEINELLICLNVLAPLLQKIDSIHSSASIDDSLLEPAKAAIQLCEEISEALKAKIGPIAARLDRYKASNSRYRYRWKALRASLNKTELNDFSARIQRALNLLLIANQTLTM